VVDYNEFDFKIMNETNRTAGYHRTKGSIAYVE
jgi:hypothetical protein